MKSKKDGQQPAAPYGDGARHVKPKAEKPRKKDPRRDLKKAQRPKPSERAHAAGIVGALPAAGAATPAPVQQLRPAGTTGKKASRPRPVRPPLRPGRAPRLDPLHLARGMSSRHLSAKVAPRLAPLASEGVERDLRHMEAYRQACAGYGQQLFVFSNQEMVRVGYFGAFAPAPGSDAAAQSTTNSFSSVAPPLLPVKIDPEEEKRAALVRQQVAKAEAARDRLESMYLSLRAHYVHESQLARRVKTYEEGRWRLLRDVLERRGRALGLLRAQVAVARDAEGLLKCRGAVLKAARSVKNAQKAAGNGEAGQSTAPEKATDLLKVWDGLSAELLEADAACAEVETPTVLAKMVAAETEKACNGSLARSPAAKGRKRGNSIASAAEATNSDAGRKNGKKGNGKGLIPKGLAPHVVPWDCAVGPRTPHGVPLLLSCLGATADRAVGYVADHSARATVTWLSPNPAALTADAIGLAKLRAEAKGLAKNLESERARNGGLRENIAADRVRRDRMVALMALLRSETEAVLERHNAFMDTPEARAKSIELHRKLVEEAQLKHSPAEEEEEEEDDEELSSRDDDDLHDDDGSDVESVGIREITVTDGNHGNGGEESDVADDDASEEGEVVECDDDSSGTAQEGGEEDPCRKRRPGSADDDEASIPPPPTQSGTYRKRRRY